MASHSVFQDGPNLNKKKRKTEDPPFLWPKFDLLTLGSWKILALHIWKPVHLLSPNEPSSCSARPTLNSSWAFKLEIDLPSFSCSISMSALCQVSCCIAKSRMTLNNQAFCFKAAHHHQLFLIHPRNLTNWYQKWRHILSRSVTGFPNHHFGYPAVSFRGCKT